MMITRVLQRAFLLVFLVAPLSASADDDENFSSIFIFGDSLSDNGNLADFLLFVGDPLGVTLTTFPFANGFTNDDLTVEEDFAVEVLAKGLGLEAEPTLFLPSLLGASLGNPFGTNYAVAGARAVRDDTPGDLPDQIDAFLANPESMVVPDGLYVIFIGNNDVFAALSPGANSKRIIRSAVKGIAAAIRELAWHGAENFLVVNVADVGSTPLFRGIPSATLLSEYFNRNLAKTVDKLEDKLDVEILEFDTFRFVGSVIANADVLGFENTNQSCLSLLATGECNFETFIFFDDVHPTAKTHALAGEAMLERVLDDDDDDDDDEDDDDDD